MKNSFIILIFFNLIFSQEKKLLFIGIDGCRSDALKIANTPNINRLIDTGLLIENSFCSVNEQPTVSGPGWSTMLTGVWYDKHGVSDNSFSESNLDEYLPFNFLMKRGNEQYHMASFIMWKPINEHIFKNSMDYNKLLPKFDDAIAKEASKYIKKPELDVLFLNFDHVDHAGHWYGFNPKKKRYIKAIEKVDGYIGKIVDSMSARSSFENEDWLIIITSDHGGKKRSHGGQSIEEIQIPIILSSSSPRIENLIRQTYLTDIVPTILHHFDIEIDPVWQLDGSTLIDS